MKTKLQLIEEIRNNLKLLQIVDTFKEAKDYIDKSKEQKFIVIVSKNSVDELKLANVEMEIR